MSGKARRLAMCCLAALMVSGASAEELRAQAGETVYVLDAPTGAVTACLLKGCEVTVLESRQGSAEVAMQAGAEPLGYVCAAVLKDTGDAEALFPVVVLAAEDRSAVALRVGDGGMSVPSGTLAELVGATAEEVLVRLSGGVSAMVRWADVQLSQSTKGEMTALLPAEWRWTEE